MKTRPARRGLYISYNEDRNGSFDEAVQISNLLDYVAWFDNSRLNPQKLDCPTVVFVKLTGKERYFRGTLLRVELADTLPENFAVGTQNHRPSAWRRGNNENFKSVLFISCLQEVPMPPEVELKRPPQRPIYVSL